MADEDKTSPVITNGPVADIDVPEKISLSSEHPEDLSKKMIAGFVINTIMMIYSHFGASGSVKLSIPEGAEINLDFAGACSGLADFDIITNDPIFSVTPNVPGFEAGVQCITNPDRFTCAADILIEDYGISNACAFCSAQYTDCLQGNCFDTCRLQVLDQEACEVCSDINCESEFEKCTGINFYNDLQEDACIANNPRLVPGNELFDDLPSIAFQANTTCVDSDDGELFCRRDEIIAPDSVSDAPNSITNDCLDCLSDHAVCVGGECPICANSTELCEECVLESSCAASFNLCSGIERYNLTNVNSDNVTPDNITPEARFLVAEQEFKVEKRNLQAARFKGDCVVKDFQMFERFEITFVDSVIRAFKGGSILLALLIGIASGLWPYCKNMLMAYAWFAKLTQEKRHRIIRILGILGKWSLVDVFAVVLIANGILIQKIFESGAPFVLIMEPRPGIYFFGFAAIWALAQGEVIHHYGLEYDKKLIALEPKDKTIKFPTAAEQLSFRKRKTICAVLAVLSMGAAVTGVSLPNLDMTTVGALSAAPGENDYLYNVFQLGIALFDTCALYDGHESKVGAVFLGLLFIFLVAVLPVVATGYMFLAVKTFSITDGESADSHIVRFALAIGNFAALDVWMVTLLVFSNQFSGIISGAVGTDNICGLTPEEEAAGVACVGIEGAVGIGFFYLVVATFLYWFAQCLAVKLNAEVKYYAYYYHNK